MTDNRKLADKILDKIKSFGFEPYDVKYGNGYFIFEMGEDSVIHFRCKGVSKHWLFGMWIDLNSPEKEPVVQIFSQYDTQIDKFKPTRSELCLKYYEQDIKEIDDKFIFYDLYEMLKFMKRHPLIAYNGFCGEYAGYYSGSFLLTFVKHEGRELLDNIIHKVQRAIWIPYTKTKCYLAKRDKCVDNIVLYDFEKENPGLESDTDIEVRVTFTSEATNEQEVRWLNKWFKKNNYGKYGYYNRVIELDYLRKVGSDKCYSYEEG